MNAVGITAYRGLAVHCRSGLPGPSPALLALHVRAVAVAAAVAAFAGQHAGVLQRQLAWHGPLCLMMGG